MKAIPFVLWSPKAEAAKQRTAEEYELKAAFLFNIAKFVEWPAGAFANAGAPIVVGVAGTDPFGIQLDRTLNGQTANGRPFRVERFGSLAEVSGCHILFLNGVRMGTIRIDALTVGDTKDFCARGGMVGLQIQNELLVIEVNLAAVSRAGLKISSQLLKLAKIVDGLP